LHQIVRDPPHLRGIFWGIKVLLQQFESGHV
jgi:hypothetical protein